MIHEMGPQRPSITWGCCEDRRDPKCKLHGRAGLEWVLVTCEHGAASASVSVEGERRRGLVLFVIISEDPGLNPMGSHLSCQRATSGPPFPSLQFSAASPGPARHREIRHQGPYLFGSGDKRWTLKKLDRASREKKETFL